ncbi:hypothetical protein CBW65_12745 [Tumebacillus avium]|uniref:Uncharacterized protein n=1 Tax=Tumebacillus avium TaxID=1903704 RepID=A0A1Y0INI2_9BACL|nr:hypothetical protein [Tumebacillus avium]ARU61800.1 hypothetical protein CBW65_12745 [Tumebacillus avium]
MYRNDEDLVKDLQSLAHAKPRAEFARQLEQRLQQAARARKRPRYRLIGGIAAAALITLALTATFSPPADVRGDLVQDAHTGLVAYTVIQDQKNVLHLADPETMETKKTIELGDTPTLKIYEAPDGRLWIPLNGFGTSIEKRVLVVDPKSGAKQALTLDQAPDAVFFQGSTVYITSVSKPNKILIYKVENGGEPKLFKSVKRDGPVFDTMFHQAQFQFIEQGMLNSNLKTLIVPLEGEPVYRGLNEQQEGMTYVLSTGQNLLMLLNGGAESKVAEFEIPSLQKVGTFDLNSIGKPFMISPYGPKATVPDQQKLGLIGVPKGADHTYVMIFDTVTGDLVNSFPTQQLAMNLSYDKDSNRWYVMSKDTVEVFNFDGTPLTTLHTDGMISNFVLN